MNNPLITIITACWRAENLPKVIESISNQTYKGEIEHLLINDNNPEVREWFKHNDYFVDDSHRHAIDSYQRFHYYGAVCRNMGVMASFSYLPEKERDLDNEFIIFFDDDNLWKPEHLQSMVDKLQEYPNSTMVISDAIWMGANDKNWQVVRPAQIAQGGIDLGQIMYKRELFNIYGVFNPRPKRKQKYDWELISKMYDGEYNEDLAKSRVSFTHNPSFLMSYRKK